MLKDKIIRSIHATPVIDGPIEVTEESYPFCSMAHAREPLDLKTYGYVEEEYFISGEVNIYQEFKDSMQVINENVPYKNRILIRKPKNPAAFSGRVFIDIYNASNGYDIEDVWRRSYKYFLGNGHIYIGITSKPINVWSLKNYDYARYHTLDWSSVGRVAQPTIVNKNMSILGTEEGLFWDILSQLAVLVRSQEAKFLDGYSVDYLYLTGQSQSGMYLNTYIYYFNEYLKNEAGKSLFDGYLNVVGAGVMRALRQEEEEIEMFAIRQSKITKLDVPFINISAQGDLELFSTSNPNIKGLHTNNNPANKIRHYEVASSPHTDPSSTLIPDNSEIVKTTNPARLLDGDYDYTVSELKLDYYVNSALEFLHQWAAHNLEAPKGKLIAKDETGKVLEDEHGNGKGGVRSPYVDVPVATYYSNATFADVNGRMELFSREKFKEIYGTIENYTEKFNTAVDKQVDEGFLLFEDGKEMKQWSLNTIEKYYK